ncbi:non-homologous end-joining factor 1 isoform X2 [Thalassophryne amazonica]|nr:non-homologous end-joining factor 1 isoform X2 [Thalassophryne amazonica]
MELSSAPVQDLLEHPWVTVSISGCQVLSKSWFGETAYHVLLSDLHCVWEERMEAAAIQTRAQELNRRLRAPVEAFFSHLCEVVRPCLMGGVEQVSGATQVSLTQQDDGNIRLRLKSELAGLPFYWEFRCTTAPTTVACAHLVRPLLVMSRLLQREVEQLGALLVKKDAEIQDFQENGATLSRERLQTDPYDDQTFKEDFMLKVLASLCSEQQDHLGFDEDIQNLYAAVVSHRNTRKRNLPETRPLEEEPRVTEVVNVIASSDRRSGSYGPGDQGGPDQDGPTDVAGAKMVDSPSAKRFATHSPDPAERPTSKPKKKKVGLFR